MLIVNGFVFVWYLFCFCSFFKTTFFLLKDGWTALQGAVEKGFEQIVKILVEHGSNVHLQTKVFIFFFFFDFLFVCFFLFFYLLLLWFYSLLFWCDGVWMAVCCVIFVFVFILFLNNFLFCSSMDGLLFTQLLTKVLNKLWKFLLNMDPTLIFKTKFSFSFFFFNIFLCCNTVDLLDCVEGFGVWFFFFLKLSFLLLWLGWGNSSWCCKRSEHCWIDHPIEGFIYFFSFCWYFLLFLSIFLIFFCCRDGR